jgi:heptosyltransferase II
MIWHLPHIRAIAAQVGAPVSLLAKPRSAADQLFSAEQTVAEVVWIDRNPDRGRGLHDGVTGLARLVALIRRGRFSAVVVLHHSRLLAAAVLAAGVPQRFGYGYRLQRPFLNRPPVLPQPTLSRHPFEQATAWLAAAGIPLLETEPRLPIATEARYAVTQRLGETIGRLAVIGIGSSEPYKQWGAERFAALADALLDAGWPRLLLVAGPAEAALADDIRRRLGQRAAAAPAALGWNLAEVAALLESAAFYVGNDTGVLNLAAAVGIRSYALFGGTPPLLHSHSIVPILPPGGEIDLATGMHRITLASVLATIRADRGTLGPPMASDDRKAAALY